MNDRDIEDTRQPDEPEAEICDDCGQEKSEDKMLFLLGGRGRPSWMKSPPKTYSCNNAFCPGKFDGVAKEMAELIVYQEEQIKKLERRIKYFAKKVEALEFHRDEGV